MAKLLEAEGLLFCDLSDFTVYLNHLDEGELRNFAEVYEGFLRKMMELRYTWTGKYLANRMGDGFIWLDFNPGTDGLSLLDFSEQALGPLVEAFTKSVKVLCDRPGLRGVRQTLVCGTIPYAEVRIDDKTVGKQSTSRIDFLSPEINRAARINSLKESEDFRILGNGTFGNRLQDHRPERAAGLIDLGLRQLKGLEKAARVWGLGVREAKRSYYL
jgi:hypothetical protein